MVGECLDQEHRTRNGSGHFDRSWRIVMVEKKSGARCWRSSSTRLTKPGLFIFKANGTIGIVQTGL